MPSANQESATGKLRLYLGYAPGVGKTFQMLQDAHDALRAGTDLVIGYFETHKRADTLALVEGLEVIARRMITHRDRPFEEMDTEAILQRKPQLCLVDEFAHTNVPGAEREKRWEDVLALLDAGINVWTTMNVQHIESLNDAVFEISGVRVRETVPDWVLKRATEVQFIDATPEALLNRLRRGAVYTGELAQAAIDRFFRESNLRALREMAMREAAHEVQAQQDNAGPATDIPLSEPSRYDRAAPSAETNRERILLLITADPSAAVLIRRGHRVAEHVHGDCLALYIHRQDQWSDVPSAERAAVEEHLNFARNLRIETRIVQGLDVAQTLVDFANRNQVTQIFLARSLLHAAAFSRGGGLVRDIIRRAPGLQITVVATRRGAPAAP